MESLKYSPRYEQIVLGTMIHEESIRVSLVRELSEKDFHVQKHKLIFSSLCSLVENKLTYTHHTLLALVADDIETEYLEKLEAQTDKDNIAHHIDRLKWDIARLTCYEKLLPSFIAELQDPRSNPDESLTALNHIQQCINAASSTTHSCGGEEAANRYMANLYARQITPTFRSTGYKILDTQMTYGFARGKMSMIVASSSIGKTTFAVNAAKHLARQYKVGYVCWESPKEDIIDIMIASSLRIPLSKLIKHANELTNEEIEKIENFAYHLLEGDNLSFLSQPPESIMHGAPWDINDNIIDWLIAEISKWDRDIIFVDLLAKRLADHSPDKETAVLNKLQNAISVENLNVHLSILHQLKMKEVDKRKDARPTRDSLKGSSAWYDVPDIVFGLYRPAIYTPGVQDSTLEVYCLKQRAGPVMWKAIMDWNGECCRISGGRIGEMLYFDEPDLSSRI